MGATRQERTILFELRGTLCLVLVGLVLFHHKLVSPGLWLLITAFLLSNLAVFFSPARWYRNLAIHFGMFFLDLAVLTLLLFVIGAAESGSLLLLYITVVMATLSEDLRKSVLIAVVISALYVWLHIRQGGGPVFVDPEILLCLPLFFITSISCGYLSQGARAREREVRSLKSRQEALEVKIEHTSEELYKSEILLAGERAATERFRSLVQDLDAIVWERDAASLAFSFLSPRAEEILGFPLRQWISDPDFWIAHLHPEDRDRAVSFLRTDLAAGKGHELDYRMLASDGRTLWFHDIVRVVGFPSGRALRLRGLMIDVTERRNLEAQLRQAQKMEAVGRLAGGVAHDFNNLLTVIIGHSELLAESLGREESLREQAHEIQRAGERAASLTRQLLAFSRQQVLAPQVVDLNTVILGVEKMLKRLIGEDIELATVLDPNLGRTKADPGQIEQIILNLAVNSRDAMPQGGRLVIRTADADLTEADKLRMHYILPGPYAVVEVEDTGCGMDQGTQAHIFEPFFTTKEKGKGTGLGLSTVYGIVKQSGGYIWVESEPGRGSTFKVYLPRTEEVAKPSENGPSVVTAQGSETILLVEDEDPVRTLVLGVLRSRGYQMLEASRGDDALKICQRYPGPINLVITDVVMPHMNGRELAKRLRDSHPEAKVLYVSGYTDDAVVQHGILEEGAAYLQKPFTPEGIVGKVRELLHAGSAV